jgi:Uma2 family endonuclease
LLLSDIDWRTYTRLLHIFAERPSVRLAYDRGELEVLSALPEHGCDLYLLGRFIDTLTEELGLPVKAGGSTTLRQRRKQRGLDPGRCWWIAHELPMRGKRNLNLRVDPPPDLAIDMDVASSLLNRMGIYAALRVPEVWRFDNSVLSFHALGADGRYAKHSPSLAFPLLTPAVVVSFLALRITLDETTLIRRFREWVRQQIAAGEPIPTVIVKKEA